MTTMKTIKTMKTPVMLDCKGRTPAFAFGCIASVIEPFVGERRCLKHRVPKEEEAESGGRNRSFANPNPGKGFHRGQQRKCSCSVQTHLPVLGRVTWTTVDFANEA
jgi:hypothetical protein